MTKRARRTSRLAIWLLAGWACASPAHGDGPIAIHGATVITGDGTSPLMDHTVVVEDGRIRAVVSSDTPLPGEVTLINAGGGFLLPGFVDTHAHLAIGPVSVRMEDGQPTMAMEPLARVGEATARALLGHGVTLARDPGGEATLTTRIRNRLANGTRDGRARLPGPELQVAGEVIDTARFPGLVTRVATADDVRAEVARQANAGVDWIKLYTGLEPELVAAGIDEAHRHGLRATGHLQATTWTDAAELGIDSLVHALPGSPDLLPEAVREEYAASMATTMHMLRWFALVDEDAPVIASMIDALIENEVSVDPTLIVFHSMAHGDRASYTQNPALDLLPPELVQNWRTFFTFTAGWRPEDFRTARRLYPHAAAFVRRLFEAGVTLTAGTDANNPWIVPGDSFHTELELLHRAGIPPMDVLTIATRNGAGALGRLDEAGTIEVGKRADLVLLSRDPTADIRATRDIVWVMKNGRRHTDG